MYLFSIPASSQRQSISSEKLPRDCITANSPAAVSGSIAQTETRNTVRSAAAGER